MLKPMNIDPAVRSEQTWQLYKESQLTTFISLFSALACTLALWNMTNQKHLLAWSALIAVLAVSGYCLILAFFKLAQRANSSDFWIHAHIIINFFTGLTWGLLALLFDPAWPAEYQVFLWILITGIIISAINSYSLVFSAFIVFYLPILLSFIVITALNEHNSHLWLLPLQAIYGLIIYIAAKKNNSGLKQAIQSRLWLEQANNRLSLLASLDELTNLPNRNALDKRLHNEWRRHSRSQAPLSLLLLEIDALHEYVNQHGQTAIEGALIEIGTTLSQSLSRPGDFVARFEFAQFVILLAETPAEGAVHVAGKLQNIINKLALPHDASEIASHITLSVGVATAFAEQSKKPTNLLRLADKELNIARLAGGNRVSFGNH